MSLKERINLVKEQLGISEVYTQALEKALKKLVDYESTEALVAALMGYYNGELKKKANTSHTHDYAPKSHTHDDRYFTESEINEKFKNFCPYAVGDVYVTTSTTNPATRWTGTTWQKIEGRFLLGTSGSGASKATGGSNSKTITQANLPNVKLTVNSFSLSVTKPNLYGRSDAGTVASRSGIYANVENGVRAIQTTTGKAMNLSSALDNTKTSTASPQTSALGSGSALDVTPAYYTCHMWLRLT